MHYNLSLNTYSTYKPASVRFGNTTPDQDKLKELFHRLSCQFANIKPHQLEEARAYDCRQKSVLIKFKDGEYQFTFPIKPQDIRGFGDFSLRATRKADTFITYNTSLNPKDQQNLDTLYVSLPQENIPVSSIDDKGLHLIAKAFFFDLKDQVLKTLEDQQLPEKVPTPSGNYRF